MAIDYISDKLSKNYNNKNFCDWGIEDSSHKLVCRINVYRQDEERRIADLI